MCEPNQVSRGSVDKQAACSSTPEGFQVMWHERAFCLCLNMNESSSLHMCPWQCDCSTEAQSSRDNYQTSGAVSRLECEVVCWQNVCACVRVFKCAALVRNAWGNRSLRHAWNATQVFLESTLYNRTWQSSAPATPTLSHWNGNSLNLPWEKPKLRC